MMNFFRFFLALALAVVVNAVGAAETLGPGDTMKVSVYGQPDLSLEVKVSEAGSITYPLLGEVKVSGLTPAAVEKRLANLLESGGYLKRPQVNIAVVQNQSQQVSVLGQVTRPGRYPVESNRSLTDILALAGGLTPEAGDKVTLIRNRNGKTIKEELDLHEIVKSGNMKQNLRLQTNDVVFVERAPRFYIYGEVQHPGTYKLERNMTVIQALSVGGGLSPRGTDRGIRVKRRAPDGTLKEITAKHDDLVQVDDVVYVRESLF